MKPVLNTHRTVRWFLLLLVLAVFPLEVSGALREWSDATGRHRWRAELFAASDDLAVLRDRKGKLHAVQVDELSEADRAFVRKYLEQGASAVSRQQQMWTLNSGLKIKGTVLGYRSGPVVIENRSGTPYVNGKRFRSLDPVYQAMLPKLIAAVDDDSVQTEEDFRKWARKLRREKRSIPVDGVLMKLPNGDEYAVPLFLFSDADRQVLESGWDRWSAEQADQEQKEQENVLLRAEAAEFQRQRNERRQQQQAAAQRREQIELMQLGLLAVDAGVTSLWEVRLMPNPGVPGRPVRVVVPARNSLAAQQAALQRNPGYTVVGSVQISRR